jgi:hypothetical protein
MCCKFLFKFLFKFKLKYFIMVNTMVKICNPKSAKAKDSDFICNPATGRWVKKTGVVGKKFPKKPAHDPYRNLVKEQDKKEDEEKKQSIFEELKKRAIQIKRAKEKKQSIFEELKKRAIQIKRAKEKKQSIFDELKKREETRKHKKERQMRDAIKMKEERVMREWVFKKEKNRKKEEELQKKREQKEKNRKREEEFQKNRDEERKNNKDIRSDGFKLSDEIPFNPEILYVNKEKDLVAVKNIWEKIVVVKNPIAAKLPFVYNLKCQLADNYKIYTHDDLINIAKKCGIPKKVLRPVRTKKSLYNLILWNFLDKCSNKETFMGDNIKDIPKSKIINLNGHCYNVDELVGYITANEGKNVDMYDNKLLYWENEIDLNSIIKYNRGLDPDIKKSFNKMLKKKNAVLSTVFNKKEAKKIMDSVCMTGWAAISDNPKSFEHNPDLFQTSQRALAGMINVINKSPNKEAWLSLTTSTGLNIKKIIDGLANSCIHGVGFKLLDVYVYLFEESQRAGSSIKLNELVIKDKDTFYSFEIYTNKGVDDNLKDSPELRYLEANSKTMTFGRMHQKVNQASPVYKQFIKSAMEAKKKIKRKVN